MKNIIKFPASRRKLTDDGEREIKKYANIINCLHQGIVDPINQEKNQERTENLLRKCVKRIFEIEEEL